MRETCRTSARSGRRARRPFLWGLRVPSPRHERRGIISQIVPCGPRKDKL